MAIQTEKETQEAQIEMLRKELQATKKKYEDLKQLLENQEKLLKEIYEVKLTDMEVSLKDHVDASNKELQDFIVQALNISTTQEAATTQQSQPIGPMNGSELVKKFLSDGGGI